MQILVRSGPWVVLFWQDPSWCCRSGPHVSGEEQGLRGPWRPLPTPHWIISWVRALPFPCYLLPLTCSLDAAVSFCRYNHVTWQEAFLSPVGLHSLGNSRSWGSVKQGKPSGGRGHCVGGEGEGCGARVGREEKNIIVLIGMWKCVYIRDLLTHV